LLLEKQNCGWECAEGSPHRKKAKNRVAGRINTALFAEMEMKKTYQKNQPESIQEMFGSIAKQYDRTNAIMSFNLHKRWNKTLANLVAEQKKPSQYLDLCCGTGEIAYTLLRQTERPIETFLLDFCQEMLDCAKQKQKEKSLAPHHLHYIQADAQQIPLPGESIDATTIAYGIRNVQDPKKCAQEVFRVLRPGGMFAILELTQPKQPVMRLGHKLYLSTFLPIIGKMTAANKDAYRYLSKSIQAFIPPSQLENTLKESGFINTAQISLTGGIATIITGTKPN
jgi:demethylmenaquinone methyltransferase / 2-methoxy-6-polyprenyl-1,4-benzoquinol methylase